MRRFLASLIVFGFAALSALPAHALNLPQRAQGLSQPNVQQVWVNPSGSDANSNPCRHPLRPCATLARASAVAIGANAIINLTGSFTSGDALALTTSHAKGYLAIVDYGGSGATINSGNSNAGITATNLPAILLFKRIALNVFGGGNLTNTTAGLAFVNNLANSKLVGPRIFGPAVTGYGYNGISVEGANGTSGFVGIVVRGANIHDVTGTSTDAFGTCAIMVFSKTGYGLGATAPSHLNVNIAGNTVANATGAPAATVNWTGCGIFVSQTGGNIAIGGSQSAQNVVHDFAGSNGGPFEPVGIWTADGAPSSCIVSYNEVYNGLMGPGGQRADGGAFDGGIVGCLAEKNKIHDNAGAGWLNENYNDGTCCAVWANNTERDNLFQNNGNAGTRTLAEIMFHFPAAATGPANVIGNTIVNQNGAAAFGDIPSSTGAITAVVANNILAVNNGGLLTNFTHPSSINLTVNDYWTYGTTATFFWNGTTYTNASLATAFAAWQTATGQEKIAGSNVGLTVNPQIYVPGGLFATGGYAPLQDMANNLQTGSPMIGAGINTLTQFGINPGTTDYYGAAISPTSLPIGAAAGDFATFAATNTTATNFLARVTGFTKLDNVNYNSLAACLPVASLDLVYPLAAPNAAASLLNLLGNTFPLTNSGATFTARQGYTGNGTNAFLDTGWKAASNGVNYTLASAMHFGYGLVDGIADTKALYGAVNVAATSEATSYPGTGTGWYSDVNDFTGVSRVGITTSKGMFLTDRHGGNLTGYFNGAAGTPTARATVAMPDQNMRILAVNGDAASFTTNTVSMVGFGAGGLNDVAIPQCVNSFMQAYAINTY